MHEPTDPSTLAATGDRDRVLWGLRGDVAALRSQVTELRGELAKLAERVALYERILQIRDAAFPEAAASELGDAPLATRFEIEASQLLPVQDGFHALEWGPEGAFRWTGPEPRVRFVAWIERRGPLRASLKLFHFGMPANQHDLALIVDGLRHPLKRGEGEKVLVSPLIPPRPGDGPTEILIEVAHMHSPQQLGHPDKRTLGIAFQRLVVEPA